MWPRFLKKLSAEEELSQAKLMAKQCRRVDLRNTVARARKEVGYLIALLKASKGARWRQSNKVAFKELYRLRVQSRIAIKALRLQAAG